MMAATVPGREGQEVPAVPSFAISRYMSFPDIMALIRNDIPDDCLLGPRSIRFKQKSFCLAHNPHGQHCRSTGMLLFSA